MLSRKRKAWRRNRRHATPKVRRIHPVPRIAGTWSAVGRKRILPATVSQIESAANRWPNRHLNRVVTDMRRRCARCWQSWSFAARGLAAAAATSGLVWGLLAAASGARPPAPAAAEPVTAPASEADGSTRRASDEKLGTDWVRLRYDDAQRITGLETAIVRYAAPAGSGGG